MLVEFGRELLNKKSLEDGLPLISKYAKFVVEADRCSIFIRDVKKQEVWTTIADGTDRIIVPCDKGIVGYVIKQGEPFFTNDPYSDPNFLSEVDKKTGYMTKNIAAVPVYNSTREIIGVLELLNKENGFEQNDIKFMIFFAHYVSGFLELVEVYR
ncbi:MAG: GAF domain-containing protein [Campylobacterales bacterium]|nr:GAF domain-containing protein [Campylobacterales bacterium]